MQEHTTFSKSDIGALVIAGFLAMLANTFELGYVVVILIAVASYYGAKMALSAVMHDKKD